MVGTTERVPPTLLQLSGSECRCIRCQSPELPDLLLFQGKPRALSSPQRVASKQHKVFGIFRVFRLSFPWSRFQTKAWKSDWGPFTSAPFSPWPLFLVCRMERGKERQRENRIISEHYHFLFFSIYPERWRHLLAKSVIDWEGPEFFLSSNTSEWHDAGDPSGKAPNRKAMLAPRSSRLGRAGPTFRGCDCQLQRNFQLYDPLSSKPQFGPRPDCF